MPKKMHGKKGGNKQGGVPGREKAKDMKGTLLKLARYMSKYKVLLGFIFFFAICGTLFSIVGPKILGMATTEIFAGLVSQVSGGSGMDFEIGRAHV